MYVPKVINKVYIQHDGKMQDPIPSIREAHDSWIKLNPGYKLKLWSLEDCQEYLSNNFTSDHLEAFNCLQAYAAKVDFFRYCIIYNEGGWYSDWKEVCLVENILDKMSEINNFIWFKDNGNDYSRDAKSVMTAFFGAIPKHSILKDAIKRVINNCINEHYGDSSLDPTGPHLFGVAINHYNSNNKTIEASGEFIHKQKGSFIHKELGRIIQHKCNACQDGQDWNKGNNYNDKWNNREYYYK
jgi:mannosyltransferase OCH1-like enzyme